ncbi:unnamed protein product, partial [Brassica rapa subsp. trilocularis]
LLALSRAELVDRSAESKPESIADAVVRIRKNYSYSKVNYLAVATAIVGFSLVFLLCLLPSTCSSTCSAPPISRSSSSATRFWLEGSLAVADAGRRTIAGERY